MARIFQRYEWLIGIIHRNPGGITLQELQDAWDRSSVNDMGEALSERTFHRHKNEIEEIFGIEIKCHKSTNSYYIANKDEVNDNGVQNWMLSTIAVDNMLNESRELRERIQFEEIPEGRQYLSIIISAMKEGTALSMEYQSYWSDEKYVTVLRPYFVKVFGQRWYVIGKTDRHNGAIRTFALDRILSLETTSEKFKMPRSFHPQEYFTNSYGIFHSDEPAEIVRIKVYGKQVLYVKSLPLHHSQTVVEETPEYTVFEYYLVPTYDFVQYILSRGATFEVLTPSALRDWVAEEAEKMARMYSR